MTLRKNKKGFTIVELVIVIAVIAILAAILIPTFANVTDSAKKAALQANIRNAYTEYVAAHADSADYVPETDVIFSDGTKYYTVDKNFAFTELKTAPTQKTAAGKTVATADLAVPEVITSNSVDFTLVGSAVKDSGDTTTYSFVADNFNGFTIYTK